MSDDKLSETAQRLSEWGPAFPVTIEERDESGDLRGATHYGMSLRDYFAGQAIAGLVARVHVSPEASAEIAYELADAMLEARKPNEPPTDP